MDVDVDLLRKFEGKYVKIVIGERLFKLEGFIDEVSDNFILFRTSQKSSLINICEVREVNEICNGRRY